MVNAVLYAVFFLFFSFVFSEEVIVVAKIEDKTYVGMPVQGSITITHDATSPINQNSFFLENKPLKVVYEKEVKLDPRSNLTISIFHFTLEPRTLGLHELPEISVIVGNTAYRSIASTYSVMEATLSPKKPAAQAGRVSGGVLLKLETLLEGKPLLYPGQRLTVGYRYIYNYSIDLTHEEIPLLEAKGFRKIGEKEFNNYVKDKLIYLDATQVIEAVKPGDYLFPEAKIQGKAYQVNRLGQKSYAQMDSYAQSAPVTIQVLPFPEEGKAPSFNGGIGSSLTFDMKLLSSASVAVGDKIQLLITIQGTGELANMPMPEVCCQPGFSGFFRVSDLPPVETLSGAVKTFKVEMRPLSEKMTEIPVLSFSFFNPETKQYTTLTSGPIPLKVLPSQALPSQLPAVQEKAKELSPEEEKSPVPLAIEIEGNLPLDSKDLENLWFGTWYVVLSIPFGIGALFLQLHMRRFLIERKKQTRSKTSEDFFQEALGEIPGSGSFFDLLERAFILRLVEKGEVTDPKMTSEFLPTKGMSGEVRAFLKEVEMKRFSGKEGEFGSSFMAQAKSLFYRIEPDRAGKIE